MVKNTLKVFWKGGWEKMQLFVIKKNLIEVVDFETLGN